MSKRAELYTLVVHMRRYLEHQRALGSHGLIASPQAERDALTSLERTLEERALAKVKAKLVGALPDDHPARKQAPQAAPQPTPQAASLLPNPEQLRTAKKPAIQSTSASPWKQLGSRPVPIFNEQATAPPPSPLPPPEPEPPRRPEDRSRAPINPPPRANQAAVPAQASLIQAPATTDNKKPAMIRGFDDAKKLGEMNNDEKLELLRACLGDCKRCPLAAGRDKIVFGDGSPEARLVFVGEAPGEQEDRTGKPFVGRAGDLLNKMIVAMGLSREEIYICNVVKCRPPQNRNPAPEEIDACAPFVYKQLEILDPQVIVTLGRFATASLLNTDKGIKSLRGTWHDWRSTPVMPTFHPAYLLRNEQDKRLVWDDLQKVMKVMGLRRK